MDRLKKVFDNLDLEVAANERSDGSATGGHELQDIIPSSPPRRRRASSADHYCIEGRLKGGSFCDSIEDDDVDGDNNNKSNTTKHEFPRKRHSTGDWLNLLRHQTSASSFGLDFATSSSPLSEIKKLDSQNSFPDFVGALGARHLALQAAKDKQRQVDQLCGSDHIDPDEERLHCSDELRGSFAAAQPKEARLRRSKHLAKFKQHRSGDNLDGSAHSDQSGYDSSSSFGSVGDLILKALASAGHELESETAATTTNISNARARRRTTKAAHQHRTRRQYRGSYTEDRIQPKTGFGQNLPCIAPTPQGFGGRRGSDYCGEEEIIYRRRSSASYASRRRSSRSAISNKGNDDSDDDDDDAKPKAKNIKKSSTSKSKSKISHKASSKSKSHRRASRGSQVDKNTVSPTTSNDSGRSSGS